MNNFIYTERDLNFTSDNLIIYWAGPIKISVSGWDGYIRLSTNPKWRHLLYECLETAIKAWELEKDSIEIKDLEIKIKYNFENLKLYIEHSIVFI